ncbi:MAG: HU family DNA-binding protein [Phycisphaerales bacterium]
MAKKTAKKAGKKKAVSKKAGATRAAASAPKAAKLTAAKSKPRTKSEVYTTIAEQTGLTRKDVAGVFATMGQMIEMDLKKGNAGVFNVPGLMKVTVVRKPATPAKKGINPFTKEPTIFKAKPARNVVKVRPLKGLKDSVA